MKNFVIYTVGWLGLVVLAILNGTIRKKAYEQFMGELTAHQLSTFSGILLFGVYIWVFSGFFRIESSRQAILIGGIWVIMTIIFEFVFGRYVMGHPWHKLFHDYNILEGRVWSLVLISTSIAPYMFYRLRL